MSLETLRERLNTRERASGLAQQGGALWSGQLFGRDRSYVFPGGCDRDAIRRPPPLRKTAQSLSRAYWVPISAPLVSH